MTWLSWRQLRTSVIAVASALVALFVVLWVSGSQLLHDYDTVVVSCASHHDCGPVVAHFQALGHLSHALSTLVIVTPILVGVFWGAPLVARELESGTYRLAWTQSVTRSRWIVVRLAMLAGIVVVVTGLLSIAVTWWQSPLDRYNFSPFANFDARDLVPVAYAAFALMLGALLGTVVKRTLVAMAGTIVGFVVVRYLIGQYLRPYLLTPLRASSPLQLTLTPSGQSRTINPPNPGAWAISNQTVTPSGRVVGQSGGIGPNGAADFQVHHGTAVLIGVGKCPNRFPVVPGGSRAHASPAQSRAAQSALQRCLDSFHLHNLVTYQPTSRYWPLQWYEAAIFVALALVLGAACVWAVRRRLP
ncbi:MAG: ABC transporter permease [Acidimicrobiales bacterium]